MGDPLATCAGVQRTCSSFRNIQKLQRIRHGFFPTPQQLHASRRIRQRNSLKEWESCDVSHAVCFQAEC
jgi:hypothetical protein